MNSDVLIIGGGVIGLSIARELCKIGVGEITIIEKGEIGREASYAAAGMLAPNVENNRIDDFYRFCVESKSLFEELSDALLSETGIDIELDRSGTLYLSFDETDSARLRRHYAWQQKAMVEIEQLSRKETLAAEPNISSNVRESLFFPDDWQVENRKLLWALKTFAESSGVKFRENTQVRGIVVEKNRAVGVDTGREKLYAGTTVLATGAWTSLIKFGDTPMPFTVEPVRGQMLSFMPPEAGHFRRVLFSPRGYIVPRADGRILVGATVERVGFDKSVTDEGVRELRAAALEIAPAIGNFDFHESWAGLRPAVRDRLPIIGPIPGFEGLIVATAHYRNGILLAPLTAKIAAQRISANVESKYFRIFGPGRLTDATMVSAV